MLITKSKFKKDDIISIKLMTGEEVVGKYISEDQNTIDLDKPCRLMQFNDGYGFVPLMVTTDPDKSHSVYKSAAIVITETFSEIKDQYFARLKNIPQATSSKETEVEVKETKAKTIKVKK